MSKRASLRVDDVLQNIHKIKRLLENKTYDDLVSDEVMIAAFERYMEIISEASRHIPEDWRMTYGSLIPWRRVFDLGNILRHAYDHSDIGILWQIYIENIDPLEEAMLRMLAEHPL